MAELVWSRWKRGVFKLSGDKSVAIQRRHIRFFQSPASAGAPPSGPDPERADWHAAVERFAYVMIDLMIPEVTMLAGGQKPV
ncbi:MAG: hypothetical protein JJ897_12865 [Marinibacterium sp.]|nr:hypothetical protein [Marinibacterium sp.]